jgi:homoserine dehydrogenase
MLLFVDNTKIRSLSMTYAAIMGYGVVGSGVVEVLNMNRNRITSSAGGEIKIKYILDVRDFPSSPLASLFTKDFAVIENDPEVSIVVETIGGARVAYDFTRRCLLAGKSVVTSNKELVAKHGLELLNIAKEKNVSYLFEASVGGGMPILRPLITCLAANEVLEIRGILNGTTNFILTSMREYSMSFEAALKQAQELGYAEADPTADIEGIDACRKLCILADLAYGCLVKPELVKAEGISAVSVKDVDNLRQFGAKIKLIGRAVKAEGENVMIWVAPHVLMPGNPLINVENADNGIGVKGNALGDAMFFGCGAGSLPTASAVIADMIDAVRHSACRLDIGWKDKGSDWILGSDDYVSRWYVRNGDNCHITLPLRAKDVAGYEVKYRILE